MGLLASTAPVAAYAQASEATADTPADADIVVTAQKRSERLVDVPIAITAVNAEKLSNSGITSSQSLGQVVPGMRIDLAGATSQPTIRGVGSALAGPGVGSAVAVYIDGIYQPNPIANNFELADIESIDVLKGPQGTLFGRNATGGAISLTTTKPSFDPTVKSTISYGRYRDLRATAVVSGPLSDTIAVGLSGLYHINDGFMKDVETGKKVAPTRSYAFRGKILLKPTDRLEILLSGMYLYNRDDNVVTFNAYKGRSNVLAESDYPNPIIPSKRGEISIDSPNEFFVKQKSLTARIDLDMDFADLVSYTGYQTTDSQQNLDFDASKTPYQNAQFPSYGKAFSQELNLISKPGSRLSWVLGAYYFRDRSGQQSYTANGLSVVRADPTFSVDVFNTKVNTRAYAAFADATYEVVDKLFLTLGGRYSIEKSYRLFNYIPANAFGPGHHTFKSFTPRAVLRYNFDPSANVYASYSKGFKSGGFNSTSLSPDPFRPEKIDAYEVGFKMSRPGFRIGTSAYFYNYKDLQVSSYVLGAAIVNNAASSKIYGADIDLSVDVTDRFKIDFGGAYTHAQYQEFTGAPSYPGTGVAGDLIHVVPVDLIKVPMQRAPKWTGTVSATYTQPIGEDNLRFFASYYRTTSFKLDPPGQFIQKGYGLLTARITYALKDDNLTVSLYGNNLTDSKYLNQMLLLETAPLQQWAFPRTYGVELGYKF
jgi:iron complex outermembrane receptor protein